LFNAKILESSESEEYYEKVLEFVEKIVGDSLELYPWQKGLIKDYLKRRAQND
jgi:hypothetical protein